MIMDKEEIKKLAKEHSDWCSDFFEWVYVQAFVHGYKHGKEDKDA